GVVGADGAADTSKEESSQDVIINKEPALELHYDNIKDKNQVVFVHPKREIKFDFDISKLKKDIDNGNLVIHLLNGNTVTIASYGVMAYDGIAPNISDVSNKGYDPFSMFDTKGFSEDDGLGKVVVTRQISSPDSLQPAGQDLASSQNIANDVNDQNKQVGNLFTPEQNLVPEFGPKYLQFETKTLLHNYDYNYDILVRYVSNDIYTKNEDYDNSFPIRLQIINPTVAGEYGPRYKISTDPTDNTRDLLEVDNGGGKIPSDEGTKYMYQPYDITEFSDHSKSMYYNRNNDPDHANIYRKVNINVPNPAVSINQITISGLPDGVKIVEDPDNPNVKVTPAGSGAYTVDTKGALGSADIIMEYPAGYVAPGGGFSNVKVQYSGQNTVNNNLVRGSANVFFEFKPVYGPNDVTGAFNTYTFSTLKDPLSIHFGTGNDTVYGDDTNSSYYTGDGDDVAYGGTGKEYFELGTGNNTFHSFVGNDTVDGGQNGKGTLYLGASFSGILDGLNPTLNPAKSISGMPTVTVDTVQSEYGGLVGGLYLSGSLTDGTNFSSKLYNFDKVYFGSQIDESADRSHVLNIRNTGNLANNIVLDMQVINEEDKGTYSNTVNITATSNTTLMAIDAGDGSNGVKIVTGGSQYGAVVENSTIIYGSSNNAVKTTILGSSTEYAINFQSRHSGGVAGSSTGDTADYRNYGQGIKYDAATGIVNKNGMAADYNDTVKGINNLYGGQSSQSSANIFIGAVNTNIAYYGYNEQYDSLNYNSIGTAGSKGVLVDFVNAQVVKYNSNGSVNSTDKFFNITHVEGTQLANDTFKLDGLNSYNLVEFGGTNTLDYSDTNKIFSGINVDLTNASNGEVSKGGGNTDTFKNFQVIIGTSNFDDTFEVGVNGRNFDYTIYGHITGAAGGQSQSNQINYETVDSGNLELNFNTDGDGINYASMNYGTLSDKLYYFNQYELGTGNSNNTVYMNSADQFGYIITTKSTGTNTVDLSNMSAGVTIDLDSALLNVKGFKVLNLTSHDDTVDIGGDTGDFTTIDGKGGSNTANFSSYAGSLNGTILLGLDETVTFDLNAISSKVTFNHFQKYIGTQNGDDTFTIQFSLNDIGTISTKSYDIEEEGGTNTLDLSKITKSTAHGSTEIVTIDLSNPSSSMVRYQTSSTDTNPVNLLKFNDNFQKIIGTEGDDIFILPSTGANAYKIDGGDGDNNRVSYQTYAVGQVITSTLLSQWQHIQGIIGSQGSDTIYLNPINVDNGVGHGGRNFSIDGYENFNEVNYQTGNGDKYTSDVTVTAGANNILVDKSGGSVDTVSHAGEINFGLADLDNHNIDFKINTLTNNNIGYKDGNQYKAYYAGSQTGTGTYSVDYSGITTAGNVVVNLNVESGLRAQGSWINVDKGNGNIDYYTNVSSIKLSSSTTNVVNVYNTFQNIWTNTFTVTGQAGATNTLSFENYSGMVNLDASNSSFTTSGGTPKKLIYTNFYNFIGSDSVSTTDTFITANGDDYTFDGKSGDNEYNASALTGGNGNIAITISEEAGHGSTNSNKLVVNKGGENTDTVYAINYYTGSAHMSSQITIDKDMSFAMTFDAVKADGSSIAYDYDTGERGFIFYAYQTGGLVIRNGFVDKVDNVKSWTGTKNDDQFVADLNTTGMSYNGNGGNNRIDYSQYNDTDPLNFVLAANSLTAEMSVKKGATDFATISNFNTIVGSLTKTNNFDLTNLGTGGNYPTMFNSNGIMNLSGDNANTSKATIGGTSSYLNPSTGQIYVSSSATDAFDNKQAIIATTGVGIIDLKGTYNEIDLSVISNQAGWTTINGNTAVGAQNIVSFRTSAVGIDYNISGTGTGISGLAINNITGVGGSQLDDRFYLLAADQTTTGAKNINGLGGQNTLDYSKLTVKTDVNLNSGTVTRGAITDNISNMEIFYSSDTVASDFTANDVASYQFNGGGATDAVKLGNTLSYTGVTGDLIVTYNSDRNGSVKGTVSKANGSVDTFVNIFNFTGGSGNDTIFYDDRGIPTGTININGGGGTNNQINLINLSTGATITIGTTKTINHTNVDGHSVIANLTNIQYISGTQGNDTFNVTDTALNGFTFDGGVIGGAIVNTVDLSAMTAAVTVNMLDLSEGGRSTIKFSGHTNYFLNINKFIGSNAGGNSFINLNSMTKYTIDGGTGTNNSIDYSAATTPADVSVVAGKINILKSGGIVDDITNIQKITLTRLGDTLTVNSAADLNVLDGMTIDGNGGANIFSYTGTNADTFSVDLSATTNTFTIGTTTKTLIVQKFGIWNLGTGTGAQTIVADTGDLDLEQVNFSTNGTSHTLDLSHVNENLYFYDNTINGNTGAKILGDSSGNALNTSNITKVILNGSSTYYFDFTNAIDVNTGLPYEIDMGTGGASSSITFRSLSTTNAANSSDIEIDANELKMTNGVTTKIDLKTQVTQLSIMNSTIQTINLNLMYAPSVAKPLAIKIDNTGATNSSIHFAINYADTLTINGRGVMTDDKNMSANLSTSKLYLSFTGTNVNTVNLETFQNTSLDITGNNKTILNMANVPLINDTLAYNFNLNAGDIQATINMVSSGQSVAITNKVDEFVLSSSVASVVDINAEGVFTNAAFKVTGGGANLNNTFALNFTAAGATSVGISGTNLVYNNGTATTKDISAFKHVVISNAIGGSRSITFDNNLTAKVIDLAWDTNTSGTGASNRATIDLYQGTTTAVYINLALNKGTASAAANLTADDRAGHVLNVNQMKLDGSTFNLSNGNNSMVLTGDGKDLGEFVASAVSINGGSGNNILDASSINVGAGSRLEIDYDAETATVKAGGNTIFNLSKVQDTRWGVNTANASTNGAYIKIANTTTSNINLSIGNNITTNAHAAMETNYTTATTTYYSQLDYSAFNTAITAELFKNSSNLSTITRGTNNDNISGFNYFHGSSKEGDNIKVDNIANTMQGGFS
ncbi:beta strand repeat-containing protein, partial [Rickettsiales bacterium LUAb2]